MKSNSGIDRSRKKGAREKKPLTDEEILSKNIEVTKRIAELGLIPEGALNYGGSAEIRNRYYEALDKIYKRLPEGYTYSFQTRSRMGHEERVIQYSRVYIREQRVYVPGKGYVMKKKRQVGSTMGHKGLEYLGSREEELSPSALRGYAKANLYRLAGKVFDPATKKASEKYPPVEY